MADYTGQRKKFRMWRTPEYGFEFSPPLHSDELFEAMKASYSNLKTHPQRMRQATIDFCLAEQLQEEQRAPPASSQASSSGNSASASFSASSPRSNASAQSPPSFQTSTTGDEPAHQTKASLSLASRVQKSTTSKSKMHSMMNTFVRETGKTAKRTPMTSTQLSEYVNAREEGVCNKHRRQKKKCPPGCPGRAQTSRTTSPPSDTGPMPDPVYVAGQLRSGSQDVIVVDQPETTTSTAAVKEFRQNESTGSGLPVNVRNDDVAGPQIDIASAEQIPSIPRRTFLPQPISPNPSNDLIVMNAAIDPALMPNAPSNMYTSNEFEGLVSNVGMDARDSEVFSYFPDSTNMCSSMTELGSVVAGHPHPLLVDYSATSRAVGDQASSFLSEPEEYKIQGQLWSPDDDMEQFFDFNYVDTAQNKPAVNTQPSSHMSDQGFNSHGRFTSSVMTIDDEHELMSSMTSPWGTTMDTQNLRSPFAMDNSPAEGTAHTDSQLNDQRNGYGWDPFVPAQSPRRPFVDFGYKTITSSFASVKPGDLKRHRRDSYNASSPIDQFGCHMERFHDWTPLPSTYGSSSDVSGSKAKRKRQREIHNAVECRRRDNINERIQDLAKLVPQHRLKQENARKNALDIPRSPPQNVQPEASRVNGLHLLSAFVGIIDICHKISKQFSEAAESYAEFKKEVDELASSLQQVKAVLDETRDMAPQSLLKELDSLCSSGRSELENLHWLNLRFLGNKKFPIPKFQLERIKKAFTNLRSLQQKLFLLLETMGLSRVIENAEKSCAAYNPGHGESLPLASTWSPTIIAPRNIDNPLLKLTQDDITQLVDSFRPQHPLLLDDIMLERGAYLARDRTTYTSFVDYPEHHPHQTITDAAGLAKIYFLAFIVTLPLSCIGLFYFHIYPREHISQSTQLSPESSGWTDLVGSWQLSLSNPLFLAGIMLWLLPALVLASTIPLPSQKLRQFQDRFIALSMIFGALFFLSSPITMVHLLVAIFITILMGAAAKYVTFITLSARFTWNVWINLATLSCSLTGIFWRVIVGIVRVFSPSACISGTQGFSGYRVFRSCLRYYRSFLVSDRHRDGIHSNRRGRRGSVLSYFVNFVRDIEGVSKAVEVVIVSQQAYEVKAQGQQGVQQLTD